MKKGPEQTGYAPPPDDLDGGVLDRLFEERELSNPPLIFHSADVHRKLNELKANAEEARGQLLKRRPVEQIDVSQAADVFQEEESPSPHKGLRLRLPKGMPDYDEMVRRRELEGDTPFINHYFRIADIQKNYPNWESIVARERCRSLSHLQTRMWRVLDYDPLDSDTYSGFDDECLTEYGLRDEQVRDGMFKTRVCYWFGMGQNARFNKGQLSVLRKARRMADSLRVDYDSWIQAQIWKHGEDVLFTHLASQWSERNYVEFSYSQPDVRPIMRRRGRDIAGHKRKSMVDSTRETIKNVGHIMTHLFNQRSKK